MLQQLAIADAYGAGFEFSAPEKAIAHNKLTHYLPHELYGFIGRYTDDTQMSIAISEALLANESWSATLVANKLVECFKRDVRQGYSKGFFELLNKVNDGSELLSRIRADSHRNGAAVRSIPLGYLPSIRDVIHYAEVQAAVTHNTEVGIQSSISIALISYFALKMNGQPHEIPDFLSTLNLNVWKFDWNREASVDAYETLSAALTCLLTGKSLADILKKCIALGGDTDSVASISVGLAACFSQYPNDLPVILKNSLDEPTYGIPYLNNLEDALKNKYG